LLPIRVTRARATPRASFDRLFLEQVVGVVSVRGGQPVGPFARRRVMPT